MDTTSFEESCAARGYDPKAIMPDFSMYPEKHRACLQAFAEMLINAEAINDGVEANWDDENEYKHIPYFDMQKTKRNPSGFRFGDTFFARSGTGTPGGSRLSYRTSAKARYAAETFLETNRALYK